jgi:hypothetical protein
MADQYVVSLTIEVVKGEAKEVMVSEGVAFAVSTFAKMANLTDQYYELIGKLEKLK